MKKKEIIIFSAIFILALLFVLFGSDILKKEKKYVVVTIDGQEYNSIELTESTDTSFIVETEVGTNEVVIKDGAVYVLQATCPNQICVHTKSAKDVGDIIVCLPHKVVIEIK